MDYKQICSQSHRTRYKIYNINIKTRPAIGQNADGRLEVFVHGFDDALWHIWQTSSSGNDDNNQGTSSPQKPTDGRPQPEKNGNNDASTWKVVHMRNDPSLYKVVDDENINIADRFHSEESAQQYVDYYKWKQSQD